MDRRLLSGGALGLFGLFVGYQMLSSSLQRGLDWILRTGWVGLALAAALLLSAAYIIVDGTYELAVRAVWAGWLAVVGTGLVVWIAIAVAFTGSLLLLVGYGVVVGGLYLAVLVPTAADVYSWVQTRGDH